MTATDGASAPSPNDRTRPTQASSWKGPVPRSRTTRFGRKRRTSGLSPASRPISSTVSVAMTETVASSKTPCFRCITCTGALCRRPISAARASPNTGSRSPSGVRTCVGTSSYTGASDPLRREPEQIREPARRQPREAAAIVEPPDGQTPVPVDTVPPQGGGLQPLAAHRLHRIAEDGLEASDFHGPEYIRLSGLKDVFVDGPRPRGAPPQWRLPPGHRWGRIRGCARPMSGHGAPARPPRATRPREAPP